ncbi:MAG: hypothetical protein M3R24_35790 [Chloroflexota bacterium]|nr:hypothetical protein [Chloroflexota bacterium]
MSCEETAQRLVHGPNVTEWDTIFHFYGPDGVDLPGKYPKPLEDAWNDVVGAECVVNARNNQTSNTDTAKFVACKPLLPDLMGTASPVIGQSYMLQRDQTGELTRIMGQGNIVVNAEVAGTSSTPNRQSDSLLFLDTVAGTESRNEAMVIVPRRIEGKTQHLVEALDQKQEEITPKDAAWCPTLILTPVVPHETGDQQALQRVTNLQIEVRVAPTDPTVAVEVVYCPAAPQPGDCKQLGVVPLNTGVVRLMLNAPPAVHGYIYVRGLNSAGETTGETVTWYQLGGGVGPASIDGHPPLAEGLLNVEAVLQNIEDEPPPRGAYILYSEARFCFPEQLTDDSDRLVVGCPLYVQVALPGGEPWGAVQRTASIAIRVNYDFESIKQWARSAGRDINENDIVLLRYDAMGNVKLVPQQVITSQDSNLHWVLVEIPDFSIDGEFVMLGYQR